MTAAYKGTIFKRGIEVQCRNLLHTTAWTAEKEEGGLICSKSVHLID